MIIHKVCFFSYVHIDIENGIITCNDNTIPIKVFIDFKNYLMKLISTLSPADAKDVSKCNEESYIIDRENGNDTTDRFLYLSTLL